MSWHCDTTDQTRTYATKAEAEAEETRIRLGNTRALVVVWESSDEETA